MFVVFIHNDHFEAVGGGLRDLATSGFIAELLSLEKINNTSVGSFKDLASSY